MTQVHSSGSRGSALRRPPLLLVGSVATLALAGCGGSDKNLSALPACASAGSPAELPASFPSDFPLPEGAVFDSAREEAGSALAEGYAPGDLASVRDYFRDELPKAGFRLGAGDAEEREAETEFSRGGIEGRLKIREIDGCDGAVTLGVALRGE